MVSNHQMRCLIPVLALSVLAGCAGKKPVVAVAPPPPEVDVANLIARGCYRCFVEAFDAATRQQQANLALQAALLATLRSQELGMPAELWIERATSLASSDPAATSLLEMVAGVSPDVRNGDREVLSANPQSRQRLRTALPEWRARLASGRELPEFRRYVDKALVCEMAPPAERDTLIKSLGTGLAPLLEYAASTCGVVIDAERLRPLVESGFVDGEYALGQWVLDVEKDHEQALRRFQVAAEAFPTSLSIPTRIGEIYIEWEEWPAANEAFSRVLAVKPRHPDALIGRTQAVSRMGRYQEGIDTATTLIDGGTWFVGQALYWRAWNHHVLKDYATARVDMTRTKTLMVNGNVFLLSGLIEWGLEDRPSAEREFQEALKMDLGQCEAAFYLGGVRAELRNAEPAIAAFRQANQCYDLVNTVRRKSIEVIAAGSASETAKARQIASHQRGIDHNDQRKGQASKLIGQLEAYIAAQAAEAARVKAAATPAPPATPPPTSARPRPR